MNPAEEERILPQLEQLCKRLGAESGRERLMARQLLKRSQQISEEKGIAQTEAMQNLLQMLMEREN